MIPTEQYPQALRAIQRLIVHAKAQASEAGQGQLAELLNDMELLPEFLADDDGLEAETDEDQPQVVAAE